MYTFHVKCRINKKHKCKFCDSTYYQFFNIYGKYVWFSTRLRNMETRLTWRREKKLQNLLKRKFSLLYKASVHGFAACYLFGRCYCQGPTLLVFYSSDLVWGTYIPQNDKNETRVSCLLFLFEGTTFSECEIGPWNLRDFLYHNHKQKEFLIDLPGKKVTMNLELFKHQTISFEECEVFRCEGKFDYIILAFSSACWPVSLRKKWPFTCSYF